MLRLCEDQQVSLSTASVLILYVTQYQEGKERREDSLGGWRTCQSLSERSAKQLKSTKCYSCLTRGAQERWKSRIILFGSVQSFTAYVCLSTFFPKHSLQMHVSKWTHHCLYRLMFSTVHMSAAKASCHVQFSTEIWYVVYVSVAFALLMCF